MNLVIFACGIIIGILVRDIKTKTIEIAEEFKKFVSYEDGEAIFLEPVSDKEKFENSKSVDDLLK